MGVASRLTKLKKLIDDEFFDMKLYEMILQDLKDKKERRILERLYEKEKKDLDALREFLRGYRPKLNRLKVYLFFALYKLFGTTFAVKFAESNESEVIRSYQELLQAERSREKRTLLRKLIRSTKRYEYMLRSWLRDEKMKYLGFVALGVTDSIISLLGSQAGFLGATENNLYIAFSTVIVGVATGVSMAAATYIQAKELGGNIKPAAAAMSSVRTYGAVTLLLTAPYMLIIDPYLAFCLTTVLSLLLITLFTYYTSIVKERPFWGQLKENLAVVLLALLLGYLIGKGGGILLSHVFNKVDILS